MPKKKTHEQFEKELSILKPNIMVLSTYINATTKIQVKCKDCGYIWEAKPNDLIYTYKRDSKTCPYCNGKVVLKGKNDFASKFPDKVHLLQNEEDAYKYRPGSHKKVGWVCPVCDYQYSRTFRDAQKLNFSCPNCGKGASYPERLMSSVLDQLSISYLHEKSFDWSLKKRYDFYIPEYEMIIEMHGKQHYKEGSGWANGLAYQKNNDLLKRKIAYENGIKKYIEIDCQKEGFIQIRDNILKELSIYFDFSKVDFLECNRKATENMLEKAIEIYKETHSITLTAEKMNVSFTVAASNLHLAEKLGKIKLDTFKKAKHYINVYCPETNEAFETMEDANKKYHAPTIRKAKDNKNKTSGKDPITGKPLHWLTCDINTVQQIYPNCTVIEHNDTRSIYHIIQ